MDDVATYSVTPSKYSEQIVRIMLDFIPKESTVLDATACIGGDTATFANHFSKVIGIEQDETRFKMLNHNLKLMTQQTVLTYHADFLQWWIRKPKDMTIDAVYIDPPWENNCMISNFNIWDIVTTLKKCGCTVVLKLPPEFIVETQTKAISVLTSGKGNKKMKIVVI